MLIMCLYSLTIDGVHYIELLCCAHVIRHYSMALQYAVTGDSLLSHLLLLFINIHIILI